MKNYSYESFAFSVRTRELKFWYKDQINFRFIGVEFIKGKRGGLTTVEG